MTVNVQTLSVDESNKGPTTNKKKWHDIEKPFMFMLLISML